MKLSWLFVILLLVFVAVFSVQNADVITVNFLVWHVAISAALVIQLAALLGALVGLSIGYWSGRRRRPVAPPAASREFSDLPHSRDSFADSADRPPL
ncbi:LapA family protein [Opitutus terrae]|uniref:Lipopolysaccharide assembly protein A domain-containing protein n=1 Tax=Opitutus terrae (strain DSM 11246 / JCM 15787 / PB90-1) TaxID=452637 RepID=B1ZZL2_OPITP|nr:LapA family protein [Opitutus terrae]ACB76415.1 hypothetical protein Oter_3135 [Opitutus terrae PB90-1]